MNTMQQNKKLGGVSDVVRKTYIPCTVTQEERYEKLQKYMEQYKKDTIQIFGNLKKGSMILSSWRKIKRINFTLRLRTFQ